MQGPPISPEEYADRYANLQEWIDSRLELTTNRDFPSSSAEVRNLLEEFQKLRSVEDPEKEKEKEEVRTMAAEIRVFELKSKKEFGVPQIKDLEQVSLKHNYQFVCLSVSPSVHLSVRLSVSL